MCLESETAWQRILLTHTLQKRLRNTGLSIYPSIHLSIYLSIYPSIYLSIYLIVLFYANIIIKAAGKVKASVLHYIYKRNPDGVSALITSQNQEKEKLERKNKHKKRLLRHRAFLEQKNASSALTLTSQQPGVQYVLEIFLSHTLSSSHVST